jgi:hypothetical protein
MPSESCSITEPVFPKNASSYWMLFFKWEGITLIALFFFLLAGTWPSIGEAILYTLIGGLALSPIFLIVAVIRTHWLHRKLGVVQFDGEVISVYDRKRLHFYAAKLADCRWFVGNRTWATIPMTNLYSSGESLLIVFPDSIQAEYRHQNTAYGKCSAIVSVGQSLETRIQWEEAIQRLNVEKDTTRESSFLMSQGFVHLWALIIFPASWFLGLWTGRAIRMLLMQWNVPVDIAEGIAFPFFVPGMVWILCFLGIVPMLFWLPRQSLYKPNKTAILHPVLGFWGTVSVVIVCYWGMVGKNDWTTHSAIAATIVNIAIAIGVFATFWWLLAKREHSRFIHDF